MGLDAEHLIGSICFLLTVPLGDLNLRGAAFLPTVYKGLVGIIRASLNIFVNYQWLTVTRHVSLAPPGCSRQGVMANCLLMRLTQSTVQGLGVCVCVCLTAHVNRSFLTLPLHHKAKG